MSRRPGGVYLVVRNFLRIAAASDADPQIPGALELSAGRGPFLARVAAGGENRRGGCPAPAGRYPRSTYPTAPQTGRCVGSSPDGEPRDREIAHLRISCPSGVRTCPARISVGGLTWVQLRPWRSAWDHRGDPHPRLPDRSVPCSGCWSCCSVVISPTTPSCWFCATRTRCCAATSAGTLRAR